MRRQVLLLDNYDSFTWNLAHLLESCGATVEVVRNDEIPAREVLARRLTHLVISPGPGTPRDAGISCDLIREALGRVPVLGVCLGHQALAVELGAELFRVEPPIHGETSVVAHSGEGLFRGLPGRLRAARYHSLVVDEASLPPDLAVDARSDTDPALVMALRHRSYPAFGLQFHPESFLTERGRDLVTAFLGISA
jgi:anthranilate synthase component 2